MSTLYGTTPVPTGFAVCTLDDDYRPLQVERDSYMHRQHAWADACRRNALGPLASLIALAEVAAL